MHKWALIFPGQGTQYTGMGKDFYDAFPVAKEVFQEADEILQQNFSSIVFKGSSEILTLTKNSQIAIYLVSIAILRTLQAQIPLFKPAICGGLSLGEYTALVASKKMHFSDCLKLVQVRAESMHEACRENKGTMQVVLGLTEELVAKALQEISSKSGPVWIANINCPGQIVIAGRMESLIIAAEYLKQKGAKRIVDLEVAGAFHSGLMRSAKEKLSDQIENASIYESKICFTMNVPGIIVDSVAMIKQYLLEQVVSPVRWQQCILTMQDFGAQAYFEIGPGKTLSGMNKRIGVRAPTLHIEKVADLDEFVRQWESLCRS
ncbi:MAG: ACP S-malonyltransferase [Chlamydiales bacterium]|jgi:[acyl-carrier-protein] S-malonyltransferase|nr:ACP S-malonyltransferase [Chlamydiales bacterium]